MKIVGRDVVEEFISRHAELRSTLDAWLAEVKCAQWATPLDIKQRYAHVSFVKNHVIFNIKGNKYRLDAIVAYNTKTVLVKRIGTHAEYDEWEFEGGQTRDQGNKNRS